MLKVSIISAVLNGERTIRDCLESVYSQEYPGIEHIVVDGGSTDGTVEIINKYKNKISKFILEKDRGIYDAINKGIKLSTGDVVATLNSDDIYANRTVVSNMLEFMEGNDLDAAYGDLVYIDRNNADIVTRYWQAGRYEKGMFRRGWVPPHPTFFCRRNIYDKYGFFNSELQVAADFELMLRFIERHQIKVGYLPRCIVKMRTGGKANVLKGVLRGNLEIINSFRPNGLRISPWFFVRKPIDKISQLLKKQQVAEL